MGKKCFSLAPISSNPTLPKWFYVQREGVISSTVHFCHAGRSAARVVGSLWVTADRKMAKMCAVVCCCLLQPWGKILPLWRSEGSKCKSCFFHNVLSELSDSLQLACCNLRNLFAEPGYCGYCQAVVSDASSRWQNYHVALWLGGVCSSSFWDAVLGKLVGGPVCVCRSSDSNYLDQALAWSLHER